MLQVLDIMNEGAARCPQCGKVLARAGRVDRRFCSTECKNHWHNRQRAALSKEKEIRRVMRILEKNREVLAKLLRLEVSSVDLPTLLYMGFNLSYFTSLKKVRHRWVYTCLDIGYELTPTRIKNVRVLREAPDAVILA